MENPFAVEQSIIQPLLFEHQGGGSYPDAPCSTSSPTNVFTTPKLGFARPKSSLVAIAIGRDIEDPKDNIDVIAPRDPISRVGFRPILSLMRAHRGAILKSENENHNSCICCSVRGCRLVIGISRERLDHAVHVREDATSPRNGVT